MLEELLPRLARALEARTPRTIPPSDKRRAGVLVPLLRVGEDPHLLYTRRAASLPHHQGQVAFPGGSHDAAQDADLVATALRETEEEIGLPRAAVRVLGVLDDIETIASRFVITPVVGIAPHPFPWRPHPGEVDHVFTVPVAHLLREDAERRETWDFGGLPVPIDHFPFAGEVIWGATHRITRNLLAIVEDLA